MATPINKKQRDFIQNIEKTLDIKYNSSNDTTEASNWISSHFDKFISISKFKRMMSVFRDRTKFVLDDCIWIE